MLTEEEVKHIALLARIGLSDTEVAAYQKDLSSVLDFFRELEELSVTESDANDGIPVKENDFREDVAEDFGNDGRERIVRGFPVKKDGFIRVKSVF
ncbi:MAG: Asp-tRNA(Asn)/Glu-tRNA(Gln) amidotransferase subunit GatC [Candidatus Moraniibacteriota bacterium]